MIAAANEYMRYDHKFEPYKSKDYKKNEYVPLKKIFEGFDAYRMDYIVKQLKGYVEKYREERREVSIDNYARIHREYVDGIKTAIGKELEAEMIEPRKKMIRGALIAAVGYSITIPLSIAFPVLWPYLFPEILVGLIAEESGRNLYKGVRERKNIKRETALIEKMTPERITWALEDLCYYPEKTDNEISELKLEEEKDKYEVVESVKKAGNHVARKMYGALTKRVRIPKKLEKFGRIYQRPAFISDASSGSMQ